MMRLTFALEGAHPIPVLVEGGWDPSSSGRWLGTASADVSFVALLVVRLPERTLWAKSAPSRSTPLPVELLLHQTSWDGLGFRFICSMGSAAASATGRVTARDYRPDLPSRLAAVAGAPFVLARIDATPPIEIVGIFFAKSDVKVRRKRVWGVRPVHLAKLPVPVAAALSRGRRGALEGPV